MFTAISRKVVGKSARDNPEWYCGLFWVHCSSKKFERMAGEAMDICLRVLKESNQLQCQEQWIDRIQYYRSGLSGAHFFDNLPRDSCIRVALNLTNRTLYLQHFMSIVNRNPISSFSGTGWSKNSMAWKRWLFWNNWSLQWSKKKNNLNEQNFKVYWKIRIEKSGIKDRLKRTWK